MGEVVKSYEDLEVFRMAFELAADVHVLSLEFPKIEQFGGIADQLRRSSKSICANLAEGLSKRMSPADEYRFLSMAMGSSEETRVWLMFAERLGYLSAEKVVVFREKYAQVCRMVFALMQKRKAA